MPFGCPLVATTAPIAASVSLLLYTPRLVLAAATSGKSERLLVSSKAPLAPDISLHTPIPRSYTRIPFIVVFQYIAPSSIGQLSLSRIGSCFLAPKYLSSKWSYFNPVNARNPSASSLYCSARVLAVTASSLSICTSAVLAATVAALASTANLSLAICVALFSTSCLSSDIASALATAILADADATPAAASAVCALTLLSMA